MINTAQCDDKVMRSCLRACLDVSRRMVLRVFLQKKIGNRISQKQRGAAAIEFAFVFPLFFIIFYGIITYGLIFVAQQSITLAAAEGARAALRYATGATAADVATNRADNACNAATGNGSAAVWLGARIKCSPVPIPCPYATGIHCYQVTVTYPNYRQNPLTPLILGPLMGVAVPTQLSSRAIIQLD